MLYHIEFTKVSIFAGYRNYHLSGRSYSFIEEGDWLLTELVNLKIGDLVCNFKGDLHYWNKFE